MADLGETLQNTRLQRGVSLEEAERATHISRRYLQALEDDDFTVFVAPVFARGFLRSYSQYLGLDPAEMLSLWPGEAAVDSRTPEATSAATADSRQSPADSESLRTEFERRSQPLRDRDRERRPQRRSFPAASGSTPGPLSRPTLGSVDPTPASVAAVLMAVLLVLITLTGFGVAKLAGKKGAAVSGVNVPPVPTSTAAGGAVVGQPKPTQTPPPRKAGSMPDLVGKDAAAAVQQLQQAGITPLVISVPSSNRNDRPGSVTRQNPAAGTGVTTNSAVTLVVNQATGTPAAGSTPGIGGQRLPSGSITPTVPGGGARPVPGRSATTPPR